MVADASRPPEGDSERDPGERDATDLEVGEPIEFVVPEATAGQRVDRVLAATDMEVSRATLQRWIDDGRVTIDGVVAERRSKPRIGARVVLVPALPPPSKAVPQELPLSILYEDEHLIVLDKAAGMVVHPGAGHPDGTLVNALLFHAALAKADDSRRPGIVHRLDKDTSGVMVATKTDAAREGMIDLFRSHDIDRVYRAIAVGETASPLHFETLHGRDPKHRRRFSSKVTQGKRAVTDVRTLERLRGASLVECRLETGRTHQIRVHLADVGHALVGDPLYGPTPGDALIREVAAELGRQALHAAVLGFVHPVSGETLRFETPLPEDLDRALARLRVGQPL